MSSTIYNSAKAKLINGGIDLDTDTIKCALVTAAYVADQDAHDFFDDITNEVSGANYTAGGFTLANKTVTQDNANNRGVFDADDIVQALATVTAARYAIIYKSTGVPGTSPLLACIDLGADVSSYLGTLTITWSASGIFYVG